MARQFFTPAYVLAGHAYTNLKNYKAARESLEAAERLGTSDPWLYNNWSELLSEEGRYEEALEHTITAIKTAGGNAKALATAFSDFQKLSARVRTGGDELDIVAIVFESFDDPVKRLRLAERLVDSYSGRKEILFYAYQIIAAQKQETPNLAQCDVEMANLILINGYINSAEHVRRFDRQSGEAAEELLLPLRTNEQVRDRVFDMLMDIALSEEHFGSG